nr:MAG TPA: hypothetical protein [Caudoviricetes sp.]
MVLLHRMKKLQKSLFLRCFSRKDTGEISYPLLLFLRYSINKAQNILLNAKNDQGKEDIVLEMCVPSRYSDDLDVELFIRESVLEFNQARYEIFRDESYYVESDENADKPGLFSRLAAGVRNLISKIIYSVKSFVRAIQAAFGSKLTPEAYANSETIEERLNEDVEKITKQIEDEILSERKGVQVISKAVNKISDVTKLPLNEIMDERAIGNVIDKVQSFVVSDGGTVLKAAAMTVIANRIHKCLNDSLGLTEKLDKVNDQIEERQKRLTSDRAAIYEENGRPVLAQITKLSGAINTTVRRCETYYAKLVSATGKFRVNYNTAKYNKEAKSK